jgi:uncharacterized protein YihD (DUF1040 family)
MIVDDDELGNDSEISAVEELQAAQAAKPEVSEPPVNIPDKYRGKSVEDIVKMHQEAEKLIGKQAQEVGEVRRLADELLKQQLAQKPQAQPKEEPEVELDFFEDPKLAVQKAVANHPDVLAAKQAAAQMKQLQTQAMLAKKHPDFADVVRDGEFVEWVKASPLRLNMFAMADSQYDFTAADELISTFKQIRNAKQTQVTDSAKQTRDAQMKTAMVNTAGTGETSKKVYRRADLIRLRLENPDRYDALSDEIMKAYAEGRVK